MRKATRQVRFCTSPDGVRIAYAVTGTGPPLVKVANWLSHLEFDTDSPVWRHWLAALSERHTLVRYDERGSGLSDWDAADISFEAWVRDLETVVDAAGLERFPLLGIAKGGAIAIAYAARHPERISHLVLYGTSARGRHARAATDEQREEADAMIRSRGSAGARSTRRSGSCLRSSFFPAARPSSTVRSTRCNAWQPRPRTRCG